MDHRTARKIQFILLFIGALVGCVGAWGFNNTIAVLIGLGIMVVSVIVWWLFYRCPFCHEQLGRTDPALRRMDRRRSRARPRKEEDTAQKEKALSAEGGRHEQQKAPDGLS